MARTSSINRNRDKGENLSLQFPSDVGPIGMVLTFTPYAYETTVDQRSPFKINVPASEIGASILLPLPMEIKDEYNMGVDATDLGTFGGLVGDIADHGLAGVAGKAWDASKSAGRELAKALSGGDADGLIKGGKWASQAAKYMGRSALDSVAPGIGSAIDITSGTAVNPHKALAFSGVDIKNFTFSWNFFPESEDESNALKNISDTIRYHSLPDYAQEGANDTSFTRAFLTYPDIVIIELIGLDEEFYIKYKPCMVKGFGVNFSSQGNAVLRGGKPAAVSMSMSVSEVRPHNRKDYQNDSIDVPTNTRPR